MSEIAIVVAVVEFLVIVLLIKAVNDWKRLAEKSITDHQSTAEWLKGHLWEVLR